MSRERGNSCGKQRYSYLKEGASSSSFMKQRHNSQEKAKCKQNTVSKQKPMQSPLSQPVILETRRITSQQKDVKISSFTMKQQDPKNQLKTKEDRIKRIEDSIVTARLPSPPRDMGCIRETDESRVSHDSQFDPYKTGIFTSQALMSTPEKNTTFRKAPISPKQERKPELLTQRTEEMVIVPSRKYEKTEDLKLSDSDIIQKIDSCKNESMTALYDFRKELKMFGQTLSKIMTATVY